MRIGLAVLLGIIILLPAVGSTQVYRWEDQDALHFTNTYDRVPEPHRSQVGPPLPVSPDPVVPAAAPPMSGVTRIPYSPGSPIFVTASIGGAGSLTLILDTGADRTMVSPEALGRLGIASDGQRAEIKGVTGTSQGSMVQVNSIEVGQARVGPLRIIAHDADLKKADGLLGRDFLEHFTVTIDSKGQQVTLAPK
jgi:aspartyl protease